MIFPSYIDIEPTTICNLDCGFCFGPEINSSEIETIKWLEVLEFLINKKGVKGVTISGGEPTLRKDIIKIVSQLHILGADIVFSTNGILEDKILSIAPFINWLSLPIDSLFPHKKDNLRNSPIVTPNYLIDLVNKVKSVNNKIKIKIGTVATKINLKEIKDIAQFLNDAQMPIDMWKIYQYTPRRKYRMNSERYSITLKQFRKLELEIQGIYTNNMKFSSNHSRNAGYLFLYANGDVIIPNIGESMKDYLIGNFSNDGLEVFDKSMNVINGKNLIENFTKTYNDSK